MTLSVYDFAWFSIRLLPGALEVVCTRCGTKERFRPYQHPRDSAIAAIDLAVWVRDHECPEKPVPLLRRARELAGVA
jgi:hypothetical protein